MVCPTKVPNVVATFPCLVVTGVVIIVKLHQQLIKTFQMIG
jgi:hypothetical protein